MSIITTFYSKITAETRAVDRIGRSDYACCVCTVILSDTDDRHWESVGFQGSDPSTDFRDMGVFALLQMLSHVTGTALSSMRTILAASRHAVKGFPLALVCINIRCASLATLRSA